MTGVVVVRHKVRQSYIIRTVRPRIAKFYRSLHNRRDYNHTGYDVTDYFRLSVIEVQRSVKNSTTDGFVVIYLENGLR